MHLSLLSIGGATYKYLAIILLPTNIDLWDWINTLGLPSRLTSCDEPYIREAYLLMETYFYFSTEI